MLRRLLFGKKSNPIILGRWSRGNEFQESVKATWTNSDHCGDIICGRPENVKNIINYNNDLYLESKIKSNDQLTVKTQN